MKIHEVLKQFEIFVTNEEKEILERMDKVLPLAAYNERERFVIENLVRKSMVSKVRQQNNTYMVVKNEQ
tara:strand:+ start:5679 stop:5885 length:207 start_codon:yes stop_codon:yes gene_type:complete